MIQIPLSKELCNLNPSDFAVFLCKQSKILFGEIKIRDIMLNDKWIDQRIFDLNEQEAFGYGIYVFFINERDVYIGKVISNFKHRMLSHQAFDNRENFGFNRLAKFIYEKKTSKEYKNSESTEFGEYVLPELRRIPVLLINCYGTVVSTKMCDRLERLTTQGFKENGYTIVSNDKNVSRYNKNEPLSKLLNIS